MVINDITISTPYDAGLGIRFDPDWRRKVAVAWVDNNTWFAPRHIYYDDYIHKYVEYLRYLRASGGRSSRMLDRFDDILNAESWYAGEGRNVSDMLEPLLLCGAPLEVVAKDVQSTLVTNKRNSMSFDKLLSAIKWYERIFFNIRDDQWLINESIYTRTYFALGDAELDERTPDWQLPRIMAAFYGYPVLVHSLHNTRYAHGEQEDKNYILRLMLMEAQVECLEYLITNRYNNFDRNQLIGKYIEQLRMEFDTRASTQTESDAVNFCMGFLRLTEPEMLDNAQTMDERMLHNKDFHDMFLARLNVNNQRVDDAGISRSGEAWTDMVGSKLKDQGLAKGA